MMSFVLPVSLAAREREPNSVYAERRARLAAQLGAPVLLFGYTGKENSSPSYVFNQEENFYYLTGHNEEGAALLILPATAAEKGWVGPKEILFLPPRDLDEERWNGVKMGPSDPGIGEKAGFAAVQPFPTLKDQLAELSKTFKDVYTLLPQLDDTGYPHAREWSSWITQTAPAVMLHDAAPAIGAMRQIKSPGEIALITKAIEASVDAQLEAMRMVRPGLYEYQVAARMVEIHSYAGCETEAYAPIVGTGFHSTVLHFNELDWQIKDGDVVLMDVGGQYSGYAADITRTVPANGHFTPRQREIYQIVLGAQNAVLAALKPGNDARPLRAEQPVSNRLRLHQLPRHRSRRPFAGPLLHTRARTPYRPRGPRRRRRGPAARTRHGGDYGAGNLHSRRKARRAHRRRRARHPDGLPSAYLAAAARYRRNREDHGFGKGRDETRKLAAELPSCIAFPNCSNDMREGFGMPIRALHRAAVPDRHPLPRLPLTLAALPFSIESGSHKALLMTTSTTVAEEDLARLERDIRQLKIEYEQYFGGGKARPPNDTEGRIEWVVKRYGDRGAVRSYGQRFRYSNLAQTYAKYRDIFHKRMQKREEGSVDRHFGAAARAIEAERARTRPAQPVPEATKPQVTVACADPVREPGKVTELYSAFREAMERSGQSTERLSRESFEQFLLQKVEQLRKQKGSQEVEFVVSVEDGKPRLKARVRS